MVMVVVVVVVVVVLSNQRPNQMSCWSWV